VEPIDRPPDIYFRSATPIKMLKAA
jgi:hypothetical protein